MIERWNSEMSCGTTEIASRRLSWVTCDVLAVDQDAAALDVVEALQQGEQGGLAAARLADQPDPLAGLEPQAEIVEDLAPPG